MTYDIYVNQHARERARERFPGFKAARIIDEVRAAFSAGRVSPRKPTAVEASENRDCLYLWTEDEARFYAVQVDEYNPDRFIVVTTLRNERAIT